MDLDPIKTDVKYALNMPLYPIVFYTFIAFNKALTFSQSLGW